MKDLKFAVLGAGNGGHAMAADLTLQGFTLNMFELPQFKESIKPIQEKGGIAMREVMFSVSKKWERVEKKVKVEVVGGEKECLTV